MAGHVIREQQALTYDGARLVVDAALARATELGVPSSVAVLDLGRELLAFGRQDGCPLISGEVAIGKAYTAGSTHGPSAAMGPPTEPGGDFWAVQHGVRAPMVTFGGGFPIVVDGAVVGAIGVGGGTIANDEDVAAAGLAAVGGQVRA